MPHSKNEAIAMLLKPWEDREDITLPIYDNVKNALSVMYDLGRKNGKEDANRSIFSQGYFRGHREGLEMAKGAVPIEKEHFVTCELAGKDGYQPICNCNANSFNECREVTLAAIEKMIEKI